MTTYVALLYSISLNDGERLSMAPLREMAEELGYSAPQTLLATGNLIFDAKQAQNSEIELRLETAFEKRFGRHIDIIVRDADRWQRLCSANPFTAESQSNGSQVAVRVMRAPISSDAEAYLAERVTETERMIVVDGDPWFHFSQGFSGTRMASATGSRRIGHGTSRNWNTVCKIGEALASRS